MTIRFYINGILFSLNTLKAEFIVVPDHKIRLELTGRVAERWTNGRILWGIKKDANGV